MLLLPQTFLPHVAHGRSLARTGYLSWLDGARRLGPDGARRLGPDDVLRLGPDGAPMLKLELRSPSPNAELRTPRLGPELRAPTEVWAGGLKKTLEGGRYGSFVCSLSVGIAQEGRPGPSFFLVLLLLKAVCRRWLEE